MDKNRQQPTSVTVAQLKKGKCFAKKYF